MGATVWDQEFFRQSRGRGATGRSCAGNPPRLRPSRPGMRRSPGCCWLAPGTTTPRCCLRTRGGAGASWCGRRPPGRAFLQQHRPRQGPWHVGVLLENTPEYIFLIAGAALCGATVVGINPTRRGAELAADIRGHRLRDDRDRRRLRRSPGRHRPRRAAHPRRQQLRVCRAFSRRTAGRRPGLRLEGLDPRSTLLLLFTSGSTGAPKAVICSNRPVGVHLPGQPDQIHLR